jgi:hypothetical protein
VAEELRAWQNEHARLDAELTNGVSSVEFSTLLGKANEAAASAAAAAAATTTAPPLLPPQAPAVLQRAVTYVLGGTSLGSSLAATSPGAASTVPAPRATPRPSALSRGNTKLRVGWRATRPQERAVEGVTETRCSPGEATEWADAISSLANLDAESAKRARGVAREMASSGYGRPSVEAVLRALVHGSKATIQAAWARFVPGGARELERSAFKPVLRLLTGGMGLGPSEATQLFSLIDRDGSGSIDFDEFSQLMLAMPLQKPLEKTLVGATLGMMRSLVTLDSSLAGKLRGEQLAKAGHVIMKLREAGFTDQDAASVVKALFLSRSRAVLLEAWEVLQLAVSSDDVGLVNVLDAHSFARLLPLLGEQLNEAKVEQLFEAVAQPCWKSKVPSWCCHTLALATWGRPSL